VLRGLARRLLGVTFVVGGVEALRDADRRARQLQGRAELGGADPQQVARGLAGAQIAAGTLLLLNRFPRLSSLVLAATVVPEAATAHAFWAESDKQHSETQRTLFVRDLGLLGGLLVSVDDKGRPSMRRRARRRARKTARAAVRGAAKTAAVGTLSAQAAKSGAKAAKGTAKESAKAAKGTAKGAAKAAKGGAKAAKGTAAAVAHRVH
jgi:uncharacterized membrane protein YphA (DoxX/SURF4 family)